MNFFERDSRSGQIFFNQGNRPVFTIFKDSFEAIRIIKELEESGIRILTINQPPLIPHQEIDLWPHK